MSPEPKIRRIAKEDEPVPADIELASDDRPEKNLPPSLLSRREFVGNTMKLAVAGALIPGTFAATMNFIAPDAFGGGGTGPVIRRDPETNAKIPLTLGDLTGNAPVVVTGEWNFLPAVIYKVKKSVLQGSTQARGYNTAQFAVQHPTEPDNAILVYEGKCKHLGCTIGWNGSLGGSADIPDYNNDDVNDGRVLCPCHQGQYDIYDLAINVPGTPPPAPLNVVRCYVGATPEGVANAIMGFEKIVQNGAREADRAGPGSTFQLYEGDGSE